MIWTDFEIPNPLLLKMANNALILIQDVWQMWKIASENGPNKFHSICGSKDKNLFKLLKNWTARHLWRVEDVGMKV